MFIAVILFHKLPASVAQRRRCLSSQRGSRVAAVDATGSPPLGRPSLLRIPLFQSPLSFHPRPPQRYWVRSQLIFCAGSGGKKKCTCRGIWWNIWGLPTCRDAIGCDFERAQERGGSPGRLRFRFTVQPGRGWQTRLFFLSLHFIVFQASFILFFFLQFGATLFT